MAEQEKTPESSVSTAFTSKEETEHIADEATRYLPTEDIVHVESTGPVILLFDEADNLFGKRTAVKDSHHKQGDS